MDRSLPQIQTMALKINHSGTKFEKSAIYAQWARKFKKVKAKKNQINQFHDFFTKIHFFAISKMAKKSIFEVGKSLKLPKIQFHEKKK